MLVLQHLDCEVVLGVEQGPVMGFVGHGVGMAKELEWIVEDWFLVVGNAWHSAEVLGPWGGRVRNCVLEAGFLGVGIENGI